MFFQIHGTQIICSKNRKSNWKRELGAPAPRERNLQRLLREIKAKQALRCPIYLL